MYFDKFWLQYLDAKRRASIICLPYGLFDTAKCADLSNCSHQVHQSSEAVAKALAYVLASKTAEVELQISASGSWEDVKDVLRGMQQLKSLEAIN